MKVDDSIIKTLKELLPGYSYHNNPYFLSIYASNTPYELDSPLAGPICYITNLPDYKCSSVVYYDLADPEFSFEDLACDIILAHLYFKDYPLDIQPTFVLR